jgi:hypothetical protein
LEHSDADLGTSTCPCISAYYTRSRDDVKRSGLRDEACAGRPTRCSEAAARAASGSTPSGKASARGPPATCKQTSPCAHHTCQSWPSQLQGWRGHRFSWLCSCVGARQHRTAACMSRGQALRPTGSKRLARKRQESSQRCEAQHRRTARPRRGGQRQQSGRDRETRAPSHPVEGGMDVNAATLKHSRIEAQRVRCLRADGVFAAQAA